MFFELIKGSQLFELIMRGYGKKDLVGMVAFALFFLLPLFIIAGRIERWCNRPRRVKRRKRDER